MSCIISPPPKIKILRLCSKIIMIEPNPSNCLIRKQVNGIHFSFYTDQDVLERSVLDITSPQTYDPNGTPLPAGLYDPRLGPTGSSNTAAALACPTCACAVTECGGHAGHITLPVPLFHPLLLPEIITALGCKCWHCHALRRAPDRSVQLVRAQLMLLYYEERLEEYQSLEERVGSAVYTVKMMQQGSTKMNENEDAETVAAVQSILDPIFALEKEATRRRLPNTSYHRQQHTLLCKRLLTLLKKPSEPCCSCGGYSPKVRHDAHNKVFQHVLPKKLVRLNQEEGIRRIPPSAILSSGGGTQSAQNDDGYNSDDTDRRVSDSEEEDSDMDEDDEDAPQKQQRDSYLPTTEIEAHLQRLWKKEPFLCRCLWGDTCEKFILHVVPVPPSRFRPSMKVGGREVEHVQTNRLSKLLQLIQSIQAQQQAPNTTNLQPLHLLCIQLQLTFNMYIDADKNPMAAASGGPPQPGIRQLLEKKEGLFRKHMMGKRVNFACRSVISPDPYVGTNEIGLPVYFCETLTYAVPVTEFNVHYLRGLVQRGPHQYPGARWVTLQGGRRMDLTRMQHDERVGLAAKLMAGIHAVVGRQLRDGDYVLMNRQPTLHKPGIMAHKVRVLHNPTQKTIRMHYANCNTYNADFDGDEMNCHYPQNELGRAEAKYLAQTDLQYIVPTDGSPLRGLIQDHVVGGVKMTQKDTFFEKWEYQQLIFAAVSGMSGLELVDVAQEIESMPPAILKPRKLWTGKQVISTLLLHLSKGRTSNLPGLSAERKSKTPDEAFGPKQEEHLVLIRDGELLRGVLDKAAFGATGFSMVHAAYEAYGPEKAGMLLNSLGRLFTAYIQQYSGHSCRVEDLVLTKEADVERRKLVRRAYNAGCRAAKAWAESEGGKLPMSNDAKDGADVDVKPVEKATAASKIASLLTGSDGSDNFAALDGFMQGQLNPLSSAIIKECLPKGLAVPFPMNTFGIMTTTGAKGSIVNQSQVTCALGQQALEGRRVPRMSSGRTLPSFAPYDPSPRSDGFVLDRFLTGIRPQEYYFHCMAGREGLVDTAVKTSRSGYLQRCLVKHLEELKVAYDYTVRNAEGGVIQFLYGEDGLDPTKATYLDCSDASFQFMARNRESLKRHNVGLPSSNVTVAAKDSLRASQVKNGLCADFKVGDSVLARRLRFGSTWERNAICRGWKEARVSRVSSTHLDIRYSEDGHEERNVPRQIKVRDNKSERFRISLVKPCALDPVLNSARDNHRLGSSGNCVSERVATAAMAVMKDKNSAVHAVMKQVGFSKSSFSALVASKYSSSLCAPGEAVGCIAAQSVGEPSTQMTLNTFHLAGSGANVTLGIPRLREIIMSASREPKTPTMSAPLLAWVSDKVASRLARGFKKLTVMDVIDGNHGIVVTERLEEDSPGLWLRAYYVTIKLHNSERIREAFGLSINDIARVVARHLVPALSVLMKKEIRRSGGQVTEIRGNAASENFNEEDEEAAKPSRSRRDDDDDEVDDDDDSVNEEDGAAFSRGMKGSNEDSSDGESSETESDAEELKSDDAQAPPSNLGHKLNETSSPTVNKGENTISLQGLKVEPDAKPLLMVGLVEQAASKTVVRSKKGIDEAFINTEVVRGRCLQTAGSNLHEMWKLEHVNHECIESNDVWAMRCSYGVEAARNTILDQIRAVFGVYGIEVDNRHLSLIADYMTFQGNFLAMNRSGMASGSSTFLQMSFETTTAFLKQASLFQTIENVSSPSANIVLGKPVKHGTGSFSLMAHTPT